MSGGSWYSASLSAEDAPMALSTTRRLPTWPVISVVVLSVAAIGVALLRRPWWSVVAYGTVLVVGCGLLLVSRVQRVLATRRVDGSVPTVRAGLERLSIVLLLVASLANGIIVAIELARR